MASKPPDPSAQRNHARERRDEFLRQRIPQGDGDSPPPTTPPPTTPPPTMSPPAEDTGPEPANPPVPDKKK